MDCKKAMVVTLENSNWENPDEVDLPDQVKKAILDYPGHDIIFTCGKLKTYWRGIHAKDEPLVKMIWCCLNELKQDIEISSRVFVASPSGVALLFGKHPSIETLKLSI